jgi:hypothetical protein
MNTATEEVKNRFEQAINSKLKGKKIRARASRGYKQFEKDYDIDVVGVSIDDYYDNYVVVAKGKNGKDYFLKPGFKVQILGNSEAEQPEQPQQAEPVPQPEKPSIPGTQSRTLQTAPQQPQPQAQPPQQPVKERSEWRTEIVKKYPIEQIIRDIESWLPNFLTNRNARVKDYVPREGVYRKRGRKAVAIYGLTIPVEDVPGLDTEQIKQALSSVTKTQDTGSIDAIYSLDSFDVRGGKYVIIIKKVTNY